MRKGTSGCIAAATAVAAISFSFSTGHSFIASAWADGWDPAIFETLIPYWQRFGAQRHWGAMDPEHVANIVVHAITAPRGSRVAEIEVVPPAPPD